MKGKIFLALLTIVASFYAVAVVYAQDSKTFPTDDDVNAIAKKSVLPGVSQHTTRCVRDESMPRLAAADPGSIGGRLGRTTDHRLLRRAIW